MNVKITADLENNAETFWDALSESFPEIAAQLREADTAVVDEKTWAAIQSLPGFDAGPDYARNALIVAK